MILQHLLILHSQLCGIENLRAIRFNIFYGTKAFGGNRFHGN